MIMQTIVLANQKGGVGKTSTLVHLAWYLAENDKKVVVIDLDNQANATYTLSDYAYEEATCSSLLLEEKHLSTLKHYTNYNLLLLSADAELVDIENLSYENVAKSLKSLLHTLSETGADYVLIDTAPSLGIRLAAALLEADFVISPIELEVYSIQGIALMLQTINNIKKINKNLTFLGMLPSRVDKRNPRHSKHLAELTKAYPNLLLPVHIGLRSSIANAVATREPVWKDKKTSARAAAKEIKDFCEYVLEKT